MNKRIASFIFALGVFGAAAYAQPSADIEKINFSDGQVNIIGNLNADNACSVTMMVIKEGGIDERDADVFYVWEEDVSNGRFEFSFNMPEKDDISGNYTVMLTADKGDGDEKNFRYISKAERQIVIDELKNADNRRDVLDNEQNITELTVSGLDTEEYNRQDKTKVNEIFGKINISTLSNAELAETFNKSVYLAALSDSENVTNAAEWVSKLGFEGYNESSDSLKKIINEKMYAKKEFASFDEAVDYYNFVLAFYEIGNARAAQMEETLKKYSTKLGYANDSDYKKYLSLSDKSSANKKIVDSLYSNNPYTVSGLMQILKNASGSGSTTGGGGGGSTNTNKGSSGSGTSGNIITGGLVTEGNPYDYEVKKEIGFSDLDSVEWAKESILALAEKNIVSGYTDGTFLPNKNVTREEFIKMIVDAIGLETENTDCEMTDVPKGAWYYKYVSAGLKNGIISGISEKEFGTGALLTRQDMAVIIHRAAKHMEMELDESAENNFADAEDMADYAKESISVLAKNGVLNGRGDNRFEPLGNCTRAEAARVIYVLIGEEE